MTRRADQAERSALISKHNALDGIANGAGRQQCHVIRCPADNRIRLNRATATIGQGRDRFGVRQFMDPFQPLRGNWRPFPARASADQPSLLETLMNADQA